MCIHQKSFFFVIVLLLTTIHIKIYHNTGSKPTKLWAKGPKFIGYKKKKKHSGTSDITTKQLDNYLKFLTLPDPLDKLMCSLTHKQQTMLTIIQYNVGLGKI